MVCIQVLLCSLSGDIFPKAQQVQHHAGSSSSAKDSHLGQMLGLVGVWVGDPQAAVHQAAASEEAPLLDACRSALFQNRTMTALMVCALS